MVNMASKNSISAIAVLDLARELMLLKILDSKSLLSLEQSFEATLDNHSNQADITNTLERRVPEEVLVNLWRLVEESSACPEVGILIGSKVNNDAKGVLANWISQCQTLDEAFSIFNDNIVLLNASENWTLERRDKYIKLSFNFSSPYEYPIAAIDRSMSALVMWASDLCGGPIVVESASFRHAVPKYKDLYVPIFGKNIIFSADENSLIFNASIVDETIKSANPYLQEVVAKRAQKVLANISVENSAVVASVRALLVSNVARYNSVESVCREMHLSRTSLYRKLKAEDKSFREILEEVQLEKYQHGLEQGMVVADLCDLLGFSDPSTFYKARKRWRKTN